MEHSSRLRQSHRLGRSARSQVIVDADSSLPNSSSGSTTVSNLCLSAAHSTKLKMIIREPDSAKFSFLTGGRIGSLEGLSPSSSFLSGAKSGCL